MTVGNSIGAVIPAFTAYYSQVNPAPSAATISNLGTFSSLFMGIGAILSVILAEWVGTRSAILFESALTVAGIAWAATSQGADLGLKSHLAARCVAGISVSAAESLVPLILQDMNYIHVRNARLAIIWATGGLVSSALGAASSYLVDAMGWRFFYWVLFIISGIAMVMVAVFVPETTWPRTDSDLGLSHVPIYLVLMFRAKFCMRTPSANKCRGRQNRWDLGHGSQRIF
jgi:MFS family permease